MKTKVVTFVADFHHNGHGEQRDRFLAELRGEQWLREMKDRGFYGGDWPDDVIGQPKSRDNGYYDTDGALVRSPKSDIVHLSNLEDLKKWQDMEQQD